MKTAFDLAVARCCRELANGAEPRDRESGICWNVDRYCIAAGVATDDDGPDAFEYLGRIFQELGLDKDYPIGLIGDAPWEGAVGVRRRELAGRVAGFLEAQS